jgi:hypothetical protein
MIKNQVSSKLFILIMMYLFIGNVKGQNFSNSINIGGGLLPFREVAASYKDEHNYVWLVAANELCRVSGSQIDCFEIPIKEVNDIFVVEKKYLVLHNKFSNACVYFDLRTTSFKKFNIPISSRVFKNLKPSDQVCFYNKDSILSYNFIKNKTEFVKKINFQYKDNRLQFFRDENGTFLSLENGYTHINGKTVKIEEGESYTFQQLYENKESYIINNGKTVIRLSKSDNKTTVLYQDSLICKTLWQDDEGKFLLGLHLENICKNIDKLLLFDKDWKAIESKHMPVTNLAKMGFAANIQSKDFNKEWNVSLWNGFSQYRLKEQIAKRVLYQPLAGKTFGIIARGMTSDNDGNVYAMAEEEHIYKLNINGQIDTFPINIFIKDKIKPLSLGRTLCYDEVGDVLIGICGEYKTHHSSIFVVSKDGRNARTVFNLNDRIFAVQKQGRQLYLGSALNRIFTYDLDLNKLDTLVTLRNKELHIRNLFLKNNLLYIGCKEGLYIYDQKLKKEEKVEALSGIYVNAINMNGNHIYVSTLNGLYVLDSRNNLLERYTIKNGLPNDDVKDVVFINDHEALIPTSKGVGKLDFKTKLAYNYNAVDYDLADDENNSVSQYKLKDKIYLGTINGINIFDITKMKVKSISMAYVSKTVTFSSDRKEIVSYNNQNKIIFKPNDLKCLVSFAADQNSKNIKYAVKRVGLDSVWQLLEGQTLELLRPNKDINLLLKCTNEEGIWSENESMIAVVSYEHFYKKPIFYLLLSSLIGLLVYYFGKRREKEIKKNNDLLNEMQDNISQLKLESLQAQMNPHFLFNAMTSIQYLLSSNQMKKAEEMLISFSKLIRMTLESSVKSSWPLSEEIDMLKLYCEIESQRFEMNTVKYEIINYNVVLEEWDIPPMLIQPFVENAFKHAFNKDMIGLLKIEFKEDNKGLEIGVIDNGIGFSEHNKAKSGNKSRGMSITKDRIALYSKKYKKEILFEINNKLNGGTVVQISIPR